MVLVRMHVVCLRHGTVVMQVAVAAEEASQVRVWHPCCLGHTVTIVAINLGTTCGTTEE